MEMTFWNRIGIAVGIIALVGMFAAQALIGRDRLDVMCRPSGETETAWPRFELQPPVCLNAG